jgi:heme-degrading monooxygenase HmoA
MSSGTHIYRVDKFVVHEGARKEFLERARATQRILRAQPGFIRDVILEQSAGPGRFNFVTSVEWESESAVEAAKAVVAQFYAKSGTNPQEIITRLGIEADIGYYKPVHA